MERPTPIIVVSGPPASGKTTLATSIADELRLPLIAKDAIKERLYDALGPGDREWSRWLGRATYPLIFQFLAEQLRAGRPAVVEATFGPARANDEFAALHRQWPLDVLQLYCTAAPEVLLARYAERAPRRHPGHLDSSIQDEVAAALSAGRWSSLELPGRCVVIDTTAPPVDGFDWVLGLAREHVSAARGWVPPSYEPGSC